MIDRDARDKVSKAVRAFMAEESTAFEFDESLCEIADATQDKTLAMVRSVLWFFYDDVKDHKIVATKEEWDCMNRLLLLLQSDGETEVVKSTTTWSVRQAVAALALIGFCGVAIRTGFGEHLFVYAMPFGVVSMVLAWFDSRERRKTASALEAAITPFPSVSALLSVRRRVAGFARIRYPKAIAGRRIREPFVGGIMLLPSKLMWLMLSPAVLIFQMLPDRKTDVRIRMPDPERVSDMPATRA